MATSLGSLVESSVPAVPTFPTTVAVPGFPLPGTIDGNVIAPPTVTPAPPDGGVVAPPPVIAPPPSPPPPSPPPSFWDQYGGYVTGGLAILGAVYLAQMVSRRF